MHTATVQSSLDSRHAPGHWVLARLGKRVLRPGGLEATSLLLERLSISNNDRVVEFAPGLGITARRIIDSHPASYTGVERDEEVARKLRVNLGSESIRFVNACAQESGLEAGRADVVLGEAMLTMQPVETKRKIIAEAARLLRPAGRYGIHEIALVPEDISAEIRQEIRAGMSKVIHHGVTAQTVGEWEGLLAECGFKDIHVKLVPFRLLEPTRLIADEGICGAVRFAMNMVRMSEARERVLTMRRTFRRFAPHLTAIVATCTKG
ncbi:methyltransferase domain-containing protein [Candidatus Sumerlaeota bacterium]|nr:methyltransferase domain-containing protein [Candidatus Sumerlaeota bacterium]